MADDDDDTPMKSDDESTNDGNSSEEQTEWLVTTRQKRSNAGNRLSSLIQQAAVEDDELNLLFAEDEDDVVFEDVESGGSDVEMDTSEDEDDQGPTADAEELAGERELEQQSRAEQNAKRRKEKYGIPKNFRNKVKIDPTASKAPLPRPKKKSERTSWIPAPEEAPTRASVRSSTKNSKELLHAQMLDREKRRIRQLKVMAETAKKKKAEKPKEITQEDRLAEAARVEKKNSKSLNSWEESEKLRDEERKAKLAALRNRKMEGPFITWWSGMAQWVDGKLKRVGKHVELEEKHRSTYTRKRKADEMLDNTHGSSSAVRAQTPALVLNGTPLPVPTASPTTSSTSEIPKAPPAPAPEPESSTSNSPAAAQDVVPASDSQLMPPNGPLSVVPNPAAPASPVVLDGSLPLPGFSTSPQEALGRPTVSQPPHRMTPSQTIPFTFAPLPDSSTVNVKPVVEKGTYNCLILENFDENSIRNKDVQCQILFNRKFPKPSSTFSSHLHTSSSTARFLFLIFV